MLMLQLSRSSHLVFLSLHCNIAFNHELSDVRFGPFAITPRFS